MSRCSWIKVLALTLAVFGFRRWHHREMAANNDVKKAGPLDPVAPDEVIPAGLPDSSPSGS